jgi:hypothetical protein
MRHATANTIAGWCSALLALFILASPESLPDHLAIA